MRGSFWLATALLLAGCLGGGPAGPHGSDGGAGRGGDGGVLQGVVVTPAIVPLPYANVTVQPGGLRGVTGEDGRFRFEGLEAGAYIVGAARAGYLPTQVEAQVVAGDADPAPVQILLEPDPEAGLYVEAYSFDGFLEFSAALGPASMSGSGILSNGSFAVGYGLAGTLPEWAQAEMVWEATQELGSNMLLTATPQYNGSVQTVAARAEGPSPLLVTVDTALFEEWGLAPGDPFGLVAYAGDYLATPAGGVGLAFEQDFTLYTHVFYGFRPDEGWRFTSDGPP